ncbi:UNVERIFIED_CONTAM: hypothetical protein K2H54_015862 [Gekko kuhli]
MATLLPGTSPFLAIKFLSRLVILLRDYCGSLNEQMAGLNFYEVLNKLLGVAGRGPGLRVAGRPARQLRP